MAKLGTLEIQIVGQEWVEAATMLADRLDEIQRKMEAMMSPEAKAIFKANLKTLNAGEPSE